MNLLLIVAILVVAGYLGGLYLFGRKGKLSFYTGGVEFLLIGAVVGSGEIVPLPDDILRDLFPFIHLELGWIGLLYGIQLDGRILRRHSSAEWITMIIETLIPIAAIVGVSWGILSAFLPSKQNYLPVVLVLAAAGSLSSPWAIGIIFQMHRERTSLMRRLRFIVGIDDGPGLILFMVLFFIVSGSGIDATLKFIGSTFVGLALGKLIRDMLRKPGAEYEPLLLIAGSVLMSVGVAFTFGFSAIYITIFTGIVLANSRPRLRDLYPVIAGAEHPFYLIFLILAGALWNPTDMRALLIAIVLIVVRFLGKWTAFSLTGRSIGFPDNAGRLALAFLSPGGISVAMVMNYSLYAHHLPLSDLVLNVSVWVLIILNPLGIGSARRILIKQANPV